MMNKLHHRGTNNYNRGIGPTSIFFLPVTHSLAHYIQSPLDMCITKPTIGVHWSEKRGCMILEEAYDL